MCIRDRVTAASGLLCVVGLGVPPVEPGDVVADVLAALVEALELVLGKVEFVDLLDALGTYHARQGGRRGCEWAWMLLTSQLQLWYNEQPLSLIHI